MAKIIQFPFANIEHKWIRECIWFDVHCVSSIKLKRPINRSTVTKTLHVSRSPCDRVSGYSFDVRLLFCCCCCAVFFAAFVTFSCWYLCAHSTNASAKRDWNIFHVSFQVNVLINIMTHSICMMSQLAHVYHYWQRHPVRSSRSS